MKLLSEVLKKDFLNVFNTHLLHKTGVSKPVCHMYMITLDQNAQYKSKVKVSTRAIGGGTSSYLYKK